jgi:hypothetical protein
MKKSNLILIIIVLIVLVAIFTNPKLDRHKEVVKTELNTSMQKSLKNSGSEAEGQVLGALLGGALIDRMIDSIVSTDNYLIFSTTKVTWEGQTKVVGIGIFGNVYIIGKFKNMLKKAYDHNK